MHNDLPDSKNAFFDRLAGDGDAMRFLPGDEAKLERLRLRLGDLRGQRVLEPGCGAGHLTRWLARWAGPGGSVDAFDPSEEMMARCRDAAAGLANVRTLRVRCEEVDFPAATFDRVVCFRVLPHFDELDPVLARFFRWLRPGGRLHIVHWDGRAALAAIHGAHGAVAEDVFPPSPMLEAAFARHGFSVTEWIDNEAEIYIAATRSPAAG